MPSPVSPQGQLGDGSLRVVTALVPATVSDLHWHIVCGVHWLGVGIQRMGAIESRTWETGENKNTIKVIQHTYPTGLSCTRPCDKVVSKL